MKVETHRITVPRGARVPEVASFVAQLDMLSGYLLRDLRGITSAELSWQPKRGENTIGMLLLHIAIVEIFWTLIATERLDQARFEKVFGGTMMDDGIPLAENGTPPGALRGKPLAHYTRALQRARRSSAERPRSSRAPTWTATSCARAGTASACSRTCAGSCSTCWSTWPATTGRS